MRYKRYEVDVKVAVRVPAGDEIEGAIGAETAVADYLSVLDVQESATSHGVVEGYSVGNARIVEDDEEV